MGTLILPTLPTATLAVVLILLTAKHLVADFLLQSEWMAHGKEQREGWARPLLVHAGCHGVLTSVIAVTLAPPLWWLGVGDFAVHTVIDRGKGLVVAANGWCPTDRWFWWSIGIDQTLHHITGVVMAIVIASAL